MNRCTCEMMPGDDEKCPEHRPETDVEAGSDLFVEINAECKYGFNTFGPFNSAHEGFAILLEEVDELKAHVWAKQKNRDLKAMRKEAIQVAAMAVRFALEVCDETRGRK